jgi:poly-gamma-glutamate synthesis protein (capsule biosynthesis protein)
MMLRLAFEKNKPITFEMEFVSQNNDAVGLTLLKDEDKKAMMNHLDKLNVIIADDAKLEAEFQKYAKTWKAVMNTWIQPYKGKIMSSLYKRGLLPSIITKKKKLLYTNLIQCEAHRDILLQSINPNK